MEHGRWAAIWPVCRQRRYLRGAFPEHRHHQIYTIDDFGDGWHGGFWEVLNCHGDVIVAAILTALWKATEGLSFRSPLPTPRAQAQLVRRLSVPKSTSLLEFTRSIGRMRSRGKWMAVPCLDHTQITSTRLSPCA